MAEETPKKEKGTAESQNTAVMKGTAPAEPNSGPNAEPNSASAGRDSGNGAGRKRGGTARKRKPGKRVVSKKIYDDAFKTMANKLPELFLGLINYVYQSDYGPETVITRLECTEKTRNGRIAMDVFLQIGDMRYHIECQSEPDGTIQLRMVEYALAAALEEAWNTNAKVIRLPHSCVLYLWNDKGTEKELKTPIIDDEGGMCVLKSKIVRVQSLSAREMVDNGLWVLAPYFILRYRDRLKSMWKRPGRGKAKVELREEIRGQMRELLDLLEQKTREESKHQTFLDLLCLIRDVAQHALQKYTQVWKAVEEEIDGGDHMMLYSDLLKKMEENQKQMEENQKQMEEKQKQMAEQMEEQKSQLADRDAQIADMGARLADKDAKIVELISIQNKLVRMLQAK